MYRGKKCKLLFFADESHVALSIYIIIDDLQTAAFIFNSDLDAINDWVTDWKVDFNPTKRTSLLIYLQTASAFPPSTRNEQCYLE